MVELTWNGPNAKHRWYTVTKDSAWTCDHDQTWRLLIPLVTVSCGTRINRNIIILLKEEEKKIH